MPRGDPTRARTASRSTDSVVEWLSGTGAGEIEHPGGTLLAHLCRTSETLADWGADVHLQTVALLHATYGTDGFGQALLPISQREVVRDLAGSAVEADVYLYGSCDREATYEHLSDGRLDFTDRFDRTTRSVDALRARRFLELTAANELDVLGHSAELRSSFGQQMTAWLLACDDHLSDPAVASVEAFRKEHEMGSVVRRRPA